MTSGYFISRNAKESKRFSYFISVCGLFIKKSRVVRIYFKAIGYTKLKVLVKAGGFFVI